MIKSKLILIAGGSGSGKTHLARELKDRLGSQSSLLSLDHFYHDLSHLPSAERNLVNFDHPNSIDWSEVEKVISILKSGYPVDVPRYDFTTHTRMKECDQLNSAPLLLLEGLWPLTREKIRNGSALSIFIDCPADIRLKRRIHRDTMQRGRTEESIRRQFSEHVAPMHEVHIQPQLEHADLVLGYDFSDADISALVNHPIISNP